ncbi:g8325 [Coccomyxa viridis]|uniref:G8325 protein n=1 Tax=Coccomyxa viridis TaxID=1274662 RepID=A0ABP1G6T4_9CHLO
MLRFHLQVFIYGFRPYHRIMLRGIPGPPRQWLFGNIPETLKEGGIYKTQQVYAQKYGPVFATHQIFQPIVMVESPELARKVLLQNNYRCVFPNLLYGEEAAFEASTYLDTRGDKHRTVRGAWQPFFFSGSLEGFLALMWDAADLLAESVELERKQDKYMDIHGMVQAMTVQVVGTTAFGVHFHTQLADKANKSNSEDVQQLLQAVYDIMAPEAFSFSVYAMFLVLFPFAAPLIKLVAHHFPDKGLHRVRQGRQIVIDIVKKLMADRRLDIENEQRRESKGLQKTRPSFAETTGERRGVAPGSFVDLLVNATDKATGESLSDLERTNQAFVMVMSAYETTANSLAFTLYMLARPENKSKVERLTAEIDAFGRNKVPTFEDLDKFPWLEACLNEGMRVYPPVPTLTREAERSMELGGYHIEKGTMLGVAVFSMHNNPAYWKEPEKYLPERFMEGTPEAAAKPAHGYLPFGEGTRACIGLRFARMEAKLTLIRLFQQFTFELQPGQEVLPLRETITLSAANGVFVKAIPR